MSDWITVRAQEIRSAEREKKAERDRQSNAAFALKAKVEPFWAELVAVLEEAVQKFNNEFPEKERQINRFEKPPNGVSIERTSYPAVFVKAQLNHGATAVSYSINRTARKGVDTVEKQGNFAFGFKDGTAAYIRGFVDHEDVAKLFLDLFFQF